jgi:hypothetical protein
MKKFLITTGLATGIVAGGTLAASAAVVDLTDISPVPGATYTTQTAASATGTADGVTWTITPSLGGSLTYNGGGDAPGAGDGLAGEGDGIGIRGLGDVDEVDATPDDREYLNLVFDQEVTLTAVFYLDLFRNPQGDLLEQATLFSGLDAVGGNELVETDAAIDAILGTGFGSALGLSFTGTQFSFAATGENDGITLDNFALAGFSFEVEDTAVIPVPAAGFLLVGALGGLGLLRRRKS